MDTPAHNDAENTATNPADPGGQEANQDRKEAKAGDGEMTLEDYKNALTKARQEAAKYRTQRNELRPLAAKYREIEEANKTAAEKQAEKIQALEAENRRMKLEAEKALIAQKFNLDPALIHGDNQQALEDHAQALRAVIDQAIQDAAGATPYAPTVPGERAGGAPATEADWLRNQLLHR